jgi:diacylglycerol kinase (ATP)
LIHHLRCNLVDFYFVIDILLQIFVYPLGTGNDLSRVLGWGSGHTGAVDPYAILEDCAKSLPILLDRWHIHCSQRRRFGECFKILILFQQLLHFIQGIPQRDRDMRMSNYISIGVDACVTLNFHQTRDTLPRFVFCEYLLIIKCENCLPVFLLQITFITIFE